MKKRLSRREFIRLSGSAIAVGALPQGSDAAGLDKGRTGPLLRVDRPAELPRARGRRVIVVGGGWAGLTMAKYLRKEDPELDVVLIEKRALFMSCPISNLWLGDKVALEFLCHSFLDAARNNGYLFLNATLLDLDRERRRVYTDQGHLDYDYLVLAPGIDYDYAAIGVTDPVELHYLKTHYPAGFMPGSEHLSIRNKLENFSGGIFLLTVPAGNYRCLPAPYERACLIAAYFKRNKIKGKVVLLDANPDVTIKKDGFHAAFDELYKGYLEYLPSFDIRRVDARRRTLSSEFDTVSFDDAAIYPRVRGAQLIEQLGLVAPGSRQKEANIDVLFNNLIGDRRVYVVGDARPMPFSKSGNTANSEAKIIARVIARRARGEEVTEWTSPHTICYSMVNTEPLEAISLYARYAYDPQEKSFAFDQVRVFEKRSAARGQATFSWAEGLYRDMFS
ncbi:FAD/NAD(P)-binding oxidoreductase [Thiohalobacter sp. IOR34]|uniref:FAD-dependent oxidoreductase n=1 Tax=Thiohalobacter sp. IOR34 TaxID=3057176 RepID=UPI0025AF55D0|nr:FAD/NAD(P)-binding oxidoreductase [Thiohalobacter sp. IOR34]WJW75611.1 FAD/NAD(P)-binding oxidoreductase [Thiohalobacter sp. IOR34]